MHRVPKIILMLVVAACLLPALSANAQSLSEKLVVPDSGVVQKLTLEDGSTLVGRITEVGDNEIKFETDLGDMTIAIAKIMEIKEVLKSSVRDGQYWFPNPNRTRLLMGPTARTLKAGKGYFFDLWIFFPGLAYGVTDNFMVSGGASIIPGADDQLFYFTPKYGFTATEMLDLAVNVTVFHLWNETVYLGMGSMTYGTDDHSLTAGLALAWNDEKLADKPAATLGGEYRFSRRASLVGESWFIPGDGESGVLALAGVRFFGEEMTIDLGFAFSGDYNDEDPGYPDDPPEDDTNWIPYVDFVWNF